MFSTLTRRASLATASVLAVSAVASGLAPSAFADEHHQHHHGGDFASLQVSKTATTSWTQTYGWKISKSASPSKTVVKKGGTATIGYAATLSATPTNTYGVSGNITIKNPSRWRAVTIKSVTDVVSTGIAAAVTCPSTLPTSLAAGKTLTCTYKAALPDATARTNTATVTSLDKYRTRTTTATAAVTFGATPTSVVDKCVVLSDAPALPSTNVCVTDLTNGSKTINYTRTFGPLWRPGLFAITNVASFVTGDTHATGSASAKTLVLVLGRHHHRHHHHYDHHHYR